MTEKTDTNQMTNSGLENEDMETENAVVVVDDVTRTYGGVPVLDSVSLAIKPGVTAVIGPNGSGKSTLLGALAGTVSPTTGEIQRPGIESEASGKTVGYLPQRVTFREGFTTRETLTFYARLVEDDPDSGLAVVGLTDAADKPVEALSGGMEQLLGIAQATLGDPPLLVLDEPASGLDPGMRERAFRTTAEQATGDVAVVVSSHNLDLIDVHADRIVMLARGRIVAAGKLDALRDEHGVDTTKELYHAVTDDPLVSADGKNVSTEADDDRAIHVTGVSEE